MFTQLQTRNLNKWNQGKKKKNSFEEKKRFVTEKSCNVLLISLDERDLDTSSTLINLSAGRSFAAVPTLEIWKWMNEELVEMGVY